MSEGSGSRASKVCIVHLTAENKELDGTGSWLQPYLRLGTAFTLFFDGLQPVLHKLILAVRIDKAYWTDILCVYSMYPTCEHCCRSWLGPLLLLRACCKTLGGSCNRWPTTGLSWMSYPFSALHPGPEASTSIDALAQNQLMAYCSNPANVVLLAYGRENEALTVRVDKVAEAGRANACYMIHKTLMKQTPCPGRHVIMSGKTSNLPLTCAYAYRLASCPCLHDPAQELADKRSLTRSRLND